MKREDRRVAHPEFVERFMPNVVSLFDAMDAWNPSDSFEFDKCLFKLGLEFTPAQMTLFYAIWKWRKHGRSIFRIEAALERSLAGTEPPRRETVEALPNLPYDAFFIEADNVWQVFSTDDKIHRGEGVYIVKDRAFVAQSEQIVDCVLVLSIGAPIKAVEWMDLEGRKVLRSMNDAFQYARITQTSTLLSIYDLTNRISGPEYLQKAMDFAANFLYLINSEDLLDRETVQAQALPKSAGKVKKLERSPNIRRTSYTVISLSKKHPARSVRSTGKLDLDKSHVAVVAGHFHAYWVKNPGPKQVFAVQDNQSRPFKIYNWVAPFEALRPGLEPVARVKTVLK